VGTNSRDHW